MKKLSCSEDFFRLEKAVSLLRQAAPERKECYQKKLEQCGIRVKSDRLEYDINDRVAVVRRHD